MKISMHFFYFILNVCYVSLLCVFRAVLMVWFCTGHFVMVPLKLSCLHCSQHLSLNISVIYIIKNMYIVFVACLGTYSLALKSTIYHINLYKCKSAELAGHRVERSK